MTGDVPDFLARLRAQLPRAWFPPVAPTLDALFTGLATAWADLFARLAYVSIQARLRTVSDGFLDMASQDYRGGRLLRRVSEGDVSFRGRLLPIFRDKATRAALIARLLSLGTTAPVVFEASRPADTGGWCIAMGYNVAGRYGSLHAPFQVFVDVHRPLGAGIPLVGGWGSNAGGYGHGALAWSRLADQTPHVTDADLYDAVASVLPVGSVAWVRLGSAA